MIFGLVPLPDRPVSQSEQLSDVWTPWSPASSILDHWALHTGAAPYSHLLPHIFPLCSANYVSETRHVHLVDTLAKVDNVTGQHKSSSFCGLVRVLSPGVWWNSSEFLGSGPSLGHQTKSSNFSTFSSILNSAANINLTLYCKYLVKFKD